MELNFGIFEMMIKERTNRKKKIHKELKIHIRMHIIVYIYIYMAIWAPPTTAKDRESSYYCTCAS